ncbi:hypothetical protein L226DRAFT_354552 [Lentinus tigrinus ALCF2SS1-7]|uniref:uncharacterized protein n=1 Tax=Lentinus tigrinus ALCF2SS1-7 TaxID=1328758 RepID=UPI001165F386|nr:hypothetical protein L226DRAFT_354552 [Lentinus tigrinus ALCF2SS1-7]
MVGGREWKAEARLEVVVRGKAPNKEARPRGTPIPRFPQWIWRDICRPTAGPRTRLAATGCAMHLLALDCLACALISTHICNIMLQDISATKAWKRCHSHHILRLPHHDDACYHLAWLEVLEVHVNCARRFCHIRVDFTST